MQKASSHRLHLNSVQMAVQELVSLGVEEFGMQLSNSLTRRLSNCSIGPEAKWSRLLHIVGIWFQVLFHSPSRGSFHLSLAVLVHYRLPRSI